MLTKYQFKLTSLLERGLEDTQIKSVNEDLKFARRYLNVLHDRLTKMLDEKMKEDENLINYDSPNWELKQAERLGYRRAIRKVIEILGPIEE